MDLLVVEGGWAWRLARRSRKLVQDLRCHRRLGGVVVRTRTGILVMNVRGPLVGASNSRQEQQAPTG